MTVCSVGQAAQKMCDEAETQFRNNTIDHNKCVQISTKYSLQYMIAPGILVLVTPILVG